MTCRTMSKSREKIPHENLPVWTAEGLVSEFAFSSRNCDSISDGKHFSDFFDLRNCFGAVGLPLEEGGCSSALLETFLFIL